MWFLYNTHTYRTVENHLSRTRSETGRKVDVEYLQVVSRRCKRNSATSALSCYLKLSEKFQVAGAIDELHGAGCLKGALKIFKTASDSISAGMES